MPAGQTNLTSLNHTRYSQNQHLLLKSPQSYFWLPASALHTWLAELPLTSAEHSLSQTPLLTPYQAVSGTHPLQGCWIPQGPRMGAHEPPKCHPAP